MNRTKLVSGLAAATALVLSGAAHAQVSAVGPPFPILAWDQKIPSATRFVVLTNWGSQAVLDRETGLVWQLSLIPPASAGLSNEECAASFVGDRGGWRLPTLQELMRTVVAADSANGRVVQGSPFGFLSNTS